jgi:branched-chain amino acid transport system permease protein
MLQHVNIIMRRLIYGLLLIILIIKRPQGIVGKYRF